MKKIRNRRLDSYIKRSFILFAVVPMALACSVSILALGGFYENTNRRDAEVNIANVGGDIDQWLADCLALVQTCAQEEEIIEQMRNRRTLDAGGEQIIAAMLSGRSDGIQLHILSDDGMFRYSTGSIPNIYKLPVYRSTGIFRTMRENRAAVRATKYISFNDRQISLSIGTCVYDEEGRILGYIVLDVYRDKLVEMLKVYESLYIADMILVDENNIVSCALNGRVGEGLTLKDSWAVELLRREAEGQNSGREGYAVRISENAAGEMCLLARANNGFTQILLARLVMGLGCMALFAVFMAWMSGFMLSRRISGQLNRLLEATLRGPATGFREGYDPREGDFDEIVRLGSHFNQMNVRTRELIANIEEKQRLLANAELNILRAQMRPHFIYNVLNDIKAMAKLSRTKEIVELVVCFGAMMRSMLSSEEEFYTVAEELDLVEKYVRMQNLRGVCPITLKLCVDAAMDALEIPRLILQPLVENSVAHGLPGVLHPTILVSGHVRDGIAVFQVADNGSGIGKAAGNKRMDGINYHQGIGISNIARRLTLYYGEEGRLEIASREKYYTVVTLKLKPPIKEC